VASEQPADESAPHRDLVVIGASAGGVEVLRRVVADLPEDLDAAVCVVLHIAPGSPSALAPILQRAGRLPCHAAQDGDDLRAGQILVAPPDRHLVVEDGRVRLTLGPRENGHRPAVDALFRSAAKACGGRVIGVILSGTRDDGAAGLAVIKACGGAAVVQDPKEALYAGMPSNAIAHVAVDAVVPSSRIGSTVSAMVNGSTTPPGAALPDDAGGEPPASEPVTTVCPECGGVLSERSVGGMAQWACRVGHRFSPDSLADAQAAGVESALWAAIRALEDRELLLTRMADQAESRGQPRSSRSFRRRAEAAREQAEHVRRALTQAAASTLRTIEHDDAGEASGEESAA
jgi:two-component system chemotaxis response regulator CheB